MHLLLSLASEVQDLKKLSGLMVLQALGRERYHLISFLPLPSHLIQLVSHDRDWGSPPSSAVKILCPIDKQEEEGEGDEEGACSLCQQTQVWQKEARQRGRQRPGV